MVLLFCEIEFKSNQEQTYVVIALEGNSLMENLKFYHFVQFIDKFVT